MIRILLTGSDGFIGSHLTRKFQENKKIQLICIDKNPKQKDTLRMNVASKRFVKYFKKKDFDYIYHFGSPCSVLLFNKDPEKCLDNTLCSNSRRVHESLWTGMTSSSDIEQASQCCLGDNRPQ